MERHAYDMGPNSATVPVHGTHGACQFGAVAIALRRSRTNAALATAATLHSEVMSWDDASTVVAGVLVGYGSVPYADGVSAALQIAGIACVAYPHHELQSTTEPDTQLGFGTSIYVVPRPAQFYIRDDPHTRRRWELTASLAPDDRDTAVFLGHLIDIDPRDNVSGIVIMLDPTAQSTIPPTPPPPPPPPLSASCFPSGPSSHYMVRAVLRQVIKALYSTETQDEICFRIDRAGLSESLDVYVSGVSLTSGTIDGNARNNLLPVECCCVNTRYDTTHTDVLKKWYRMLNRPGTAPATDIQDVLNANITVGGIPVTATGWRSIPKTWHQAWRPHAYHLHDFIGVNDNHIDIVTHIVKQYCMTRGDDGFTNWKANLDDYVTHALQ